MNSVAQSCLTLCDPMDCSMPGFPVLHYLLEFAQTHVQTLHLFKVPHHLRELRWEAGGGGGKEGQVRGLGLADTQYYI